MSDELPFSPVTLSHVARFRQSPAPETPASANVAIPAWQASAARASGIATPAPDRFAEPHVQVEQRIQLQFAQQIAVAGFGRDVPGAAMIERAGIEARERQHRRCRDETVEQHGNVMPPRGEYSAGDRREFAAAKRCRHRERIAENGAMEIQRGLDRRAFARQPVVVDAGAAAGPARAPPPSRAAHSIAAAVVFAIPISPTASRSQSSGTVR